MLFIYVSEIQEESPMDNKQHWKRGNETYTSYKKVRGRKIIREREIQKGILVAYKHGDVPTRGYILLSMIDYIRYNIRRRHIDRGS
jgi:hypothetical protein